MTEFVYNDDSPTWANQYLWGPLLRVLASHAPAPCDVMELGCGNGATARMLAARGYRVTAVDPSTSGIAIARAGSSEQLRFEIGTTADNLSEMFGTFSVVISLEVIEHCASAREFIRSFSSLISPGGVGIFSTPYHGYLKTLAIVASGRFDRHFDALWEGGHLKFFTEEQLRKLLDEFGLTDRDFIHVGRIRPFSKSVLVTVRKPR
jgi:2-polyprenyl-3-methyl-5-hydroxy-6-metoxy-1,4-benzoquinol methylase